MRPVFDPKGGPDVLVEKMLGRAYEVVKRVYEHLEELRNLDGVLGEIPELAHTSVEGALAEAMPPIRTELASAVAASHNWAEQSELSAEAAENSAREATKVNMMFPFVYQSYQPIYNVTEISGQPDTNTVGLALLVDGKIVLDFTTLGSTTFKLNSPDAYPDNTPMHIIVNAHFNDLVHNFNQLLGALSVEYINAAELNGRWCGLRSLAPTTRINGTALQEGDEYQNTTDKLRYTWSGSAWVALNSSAQQLESRLASTVITDGAHIVKHKQGSVASYLDSMTTGLGNVSPDGLLQIWVGDSTTEQAGGSGFLFDTISTYWRGPGMPAEKMLGTINFGGSGYRLKNFVEDGVNNSFVGPTGAMPGVAAAAGTWDYWGHKPAGAVSLATAIKYRGQIPAYVNSVQWVFCYGINDLILYNDVGAKSIEEIAAYLLEYILKAVGTIQANFPGDTVILRMPNPMAARPVNVQFPSSSAWPSFNTDEAYATQMMTKWNSALRLAYQLAQYVFPRTALFDTWKTVFGQSNPSIPAGTLANQNPLLQDPVHPSNYGYRYSGHEVMNMLFGSTQTRQTYSGRKLAADRKITNGWPGNPWDHYGQYFRNNQKFKELGSFNIVGAGSNFFDIEANAADLKKILSGFGAGKIYCAVGTDEFASVGFVLGNFTALAIAASGTNSRITGGFQPTSIYGSRSLVTFYTDNYLSPPKVSFAGPLVQDTSVFYAIMDLIPGGLASITLTTTLAVSTPVTVQVYRHVSNTRVLIATGTIAGNGFNVTLTSGVDFTAIASIGVLQEVWEIRPTVAAVVAGCAIKATLNPA